MNERRKHVRMPAYLGGRVAFNRLSSTMNCLVRNFSPAGGRLVFPAPMTLPNELYLIIPAKDFEGQASVAWRTETELGVAFERAGGATVPISLDQVRRIKKLEAEKAALEKRVSDLSSPA